MVDPSSSLTLWAWCYTGLLLQVDVCFSVCTMNGEASLGGAMSGGRFWDGVLVRSKSQFQGARYFHILLHILSDPIENPNLTGFSILLASSTPSFDLCLLLHQNSQKHNQLEKPPISWNPSVNVIYVWLIFFLLPTTPIAYVFHCRCSSSANCSTCQIQYIVNWLLECIVLL